MYSSYFEALIMLLGVLGLLFAPVFAFTFLLYLSWRSGKRDAWQRSNREYPSCPSCQYPMKGLTTARCPECGEEYTLDALWVAQRDVR